MGSEEPSHLLETVERAMIDVVPLEISGFRHPPGDVLAGEAGIVMGYALRHPDGIVLVDTGIGLAHPALEPYQTNSHALNELLAEHDIAVDDVIAIANSHLHFDHCGQNQLFPGRPIFVQRAEYEAAHTERYTIVEWVDFPGADIQLSDGDAEIASDIRVLATPGHTAGHQSVVIGKQNPTIIVGQAVYTRAEWEGATDERASGEPSAWNRQLYRESVAKLRALQPRAVHFGHDTQPWLPE